MKGLVWESAVIADNGTTSAAVDLGKPFKSLVVYLPALIAGTVAIHTARDADGTFQALSVISTNDADDDPILMSSTEGAINLTVPFFGWQHLKFVAGAGQTSGPITIYCAGFD